MPFRESPPSAVRRTGTGRTSTGERTWQSSWADAVVQVRDDGRAVSKTLCKDMECRVGTLLPSDGASEVPTWSPDLSRSPLITHTWTHTHNSPLTTHKHLCHLGSAAWYWHRVTHNPKCLLSQPTMFRAQEQVFPSCALSLKHHVLFPNIPRF